MKMRWLWLGVLLVGIACGAVLAQRLEQHWNSSAPAVRAPLVVPADLARLQDSFNSVIEAVKPSVVHIMVRTATTRGFGSGVIVDREGHIVTNFHVIKSSRSLAVNLVDGRTLPATVVGYSQEADIAVIQIKPPSDILPASLGDSDAIRVGDQVLAIGSPYGLKHTVTHGIVSAKERALGLDSYGDFIQTDAAINRGNSGGPLVNLKGEVIGINTMIFSETGDSIGLGFARAINVVKSVLDRIIAGRKSGYVGIAAIEFDNPFFVQQLNETFNLGVTSVEEVLRELGLKKPDGVLVIEVIKGHPADRAGVKPLDVIVEFNGRPVKNFTAFRGWIKETAPGTDVKVKILRGGSEMEFKVKIGENPQEK